MPTRAFLDSNVFIFGVERPTSNSRRILDHLGLGTSAQDKPPPAREILRVAEQGEAWGVPANWE